MGIQSLMYLRHRTSVRHQGAKIEAYSDSSIELPLNCHTREGGYPLIHIYLIIDPQYKHLGMTAPLQYLNYYSLTMEDFLQR